MKTHRKPGDNKKQAKTNLNDKVGVKKAAQTESPVGTSVTSAFSEHPGFTKRKKSYIKGLIKLDMTPNVILEERNNPILTKRGLKHLENQWGTNDEGVLRKAKNRESAKNSRQRKRVYIKVLEEKFANQEQMISDLKVQLDAAKHGWRPMTEESWARPLLALQWSKKMNGKDTELLSLLRSYSVAFAQARTRTASKAKCGSRKSRGPSRRFSKWLSLTTLSTACLNLGTLLSSRKKNWTSFLWTTPKISVRPN